jgi:hypothetical protein
VNLWVKVLERYSKFGDSVGSVLRKFQVQEEDRIGSNINLDVDLRCWGKSRCVAIRS